MHITDKDIAEYKALYESRFGKVIDNMEARSQLSKLVRQMEIVYQPITKEQFDKYSSKEKTDDKLTDKPK